MRISSDPLSKTKPLIDDISKLHTSNTLAKNNYTLTLLYIVTGYKSSRPTEHVTG